MNTIMQAGASFSTVAERGIPLAFQNLIRNGSDALDAADLNFSVDSKPLSELTDARFADRWHAAVRSNDGAIIGVNSNRFVHHQPSDLAALGEAIVSIRDDAFFSAGGQSKDGRTQFLVVTLNGEPIVGRDGGYFSSILLTNGTNGNAMLRGVAFSTRLICMNQFPSIRKNGAELFKLGHTWSARQAIPTAVKALQDAARIWDEMDVTIERLLNTPVQQPFTVAEQIAGVKPEEEGRARTEWEKRFDAIVREYTADYNADISGSAWGMVMAAQAVDEHHGRAREGNRMIQRINRINRNTYPMMERALALV
jgi:hypothetical protein